MPNDITSKTRPVDSGRVAVEPIFPWVRVAEFIPKGFDLTISGLYLVKDKEDELISGPCWISSVTRAREGSEWGNVIHWIDRDGGEKSFAIPAKRIYESRSPIAGDLAAQGLKVVPGRERLLMRYLGQFDLPDRFRHLAVSQLGWVTDHEDSPVYVLPEIVIGDAVEEVVFQPEEHCPTTRTIRQRGTLKQWQKHVAEPCRENPLLAFSICVAFAGPLLKFAGLECGGFHLYGRTSKGKTTALQVAASVWGSGADPAESNDSYISRWNTTGNALEGTAAAHNDGFLALDEMGTCDARDFGKVVYDLHGGKGKARLDKNSMLQATRAWRLITLSTGEISVRQKIEEDCGRRARAGQLVRLADIPIGDGLIESAKGPERARFVVDLKRQCARYFGTAGQAFLSALITEYKEVPHLHFAIEELVSSIENVLVRDRELESHQRRVFRRFAAVAAAGKLAALMEVLPYELADVWRAVEHASDAWLGDKANQSEAVLGIEAVRDFILGNGARFRLANDERAFVHSPIAGYRDPGKGLFLFTESGLREACGGLDRQVVLDELIRQGHLFQNETNRKTTKHVIHGLQGRVRLYAVRESLLNADKS